MNIPRSLRDAKILWAQARKEYLTYIEKTGLVSDSEDDEVRDHKLAEIGLFLYSLPHIRPHMKAWMVDIKFGNEVPFGEKVEDGSSLSEEHLDDILEDPAGFTSKIGGPLISNIEADINCLGVSVTDRGFGMGGGHVGCPCSDNERDAVLNMVFMKYHKAVNSGLVYPMVSWFKPFFGGLMIIDEINEFLDDIN